MTVYAKYDPILVDFATKGVFDISQEPEAQLAAEKRQTIPSGRQGFFSRLGPPQKFRAGAA